MKRFTSWLKQLGPGKKVSLGIATLFVVGAASAQSSPPPAPTTPAPTKPASQQAPVITTKTEIETQPIPYTSTTVNDSTLASGTKKVTTTGVDGVKTLTYKVTYTDGKQTKKDLASSVDTTQPVTQVTTLGTYVAPAPKQSASASCDPNYSGACVPIASDVDCAGGSGNGPAYVSGPVRVIGTDIYGLDRDGDGVACE